MSERHAAGDLVIRVSERCEDLADAWQDIQRDGACYPFQTFAWVSTLLKTVGRAHNRRPRLVLVSDSAGRPLMLIPFAVRRARGLAILEFVDFQLSDYNAPIIQPDFAQVLARTGFAALWSRILASVGPVDALLFEKMPADVEGAPNPFLQLPCAMAERAHFADLEGGAKPYLSTRSKGALTSLGRKRRNLAKSGAVTFRVAETGEEAERMAETMIRLKSRRYRTTGVADLFEDASYGAFYRAMARREGGGLVHLSALLLGDHTVSVTLSTDFKGRLCHLMPASDLDTFFRHSPGQLHLLDLVGWCGDHGRRILDFTWGDEDYKRSWETGTVALYTCCRGRSVRGWAWSRGFLFQKTLYQASKRWLKRHPGLLARAKTLRKRLRRAPAPGLA